LTRSRKDHVRAFYDEAADRYQKVFTDGAMSGVRRVERAAIDLYLDPQPGEEILDAGCGTGFYALPLVEKGCLVTGIDLSPGMVAAARDRGIDAHLADLESFDLSRTFDKILCGGSLEFCSDLEAIFANFAHHLKPNGRLVVLYLRHGPGGWLFYLYHLLINRIRVQLFTQTRMKRLSEGAGLVYEGGKHAGPFAGASWMTRRLPPKEQDREAQVD
jgi:SAM-dependent methyltransferase